MARNRTLCNFDYGGEETVEITRETKKEYIKSGGGFCMNCRSGNISAGRFEVDGGEVWQTMECYDCRAHWNDIYRLIGVDNVEVPQKEEVNG